MEVRPLQSLGVRLLVPLFVTIGVVLAGYATLSFRSTEDHFLRLARGDVDRTAGLIKRATHDGMLLNRKPDVQATIRRLADGPEIAAIRIYDKAGKVVLSASEGEIGQKIDLDSETCRSCHQGRPIRDTVIVEPSSRSKIDLRPDVLRHLSVIENEPGCSTAACHAHPADQRVLGVLDLQMSMAPLTEAVQTARRQFLLAWVVLTCIVLAVVAVFIRRGLQRPIAQLSAATRRIADGDLETRVEIRGHHELAQLADAFNHMAQDLAAARREVLAWSQQLEEKVVAKTEELRLAQRQVLHMEKMGSLGKLSATVAHEINNPLSGMLAYARLTRRELESQPLDPAVREELNGYLTLIENECARCGGIVQNLLLFARKSGATMAAVDLNDVVRQSLMLVRHHLEMRGLTLCCELLEGDSRIVADAGQLQQALVALLVNAVEAMHGLEPGQGRLTVRLAGTPQDVRIEIGDTGVGIPPDVLPRIFEPFFSTKDAENGVGLGLSVVYGIVQRHGGHIDVDSHLGHGTVFHLRLPREAQTAHATEAADEES